MRGLQCASIKYEWQTGIRASQVRIPPGQNRRQAFPILKGGIVADVEIERGTNRTVEVRGNTTDHYKPHLRRNETLDLALEQHYSTIRIERKNATASSNRCNR